MSTLNELCVSFLSRHPVLNSADGIMNDCGPHTPSYGVRFLKEFPELQGHELYLVGYRNELPNRYNKNEYAEYENPDKNFHQYVLLVKDPENLDTSLVIDFTHRILDSEGPAIKISTLDEIKAEWLFIGFDREALEYWTSIQAFFVQRDPEWQQQANHYTTNEQIAGGVAEQNGYLKEHTPQILRDVAEGRSIFTGTADDNPLLKDFEEYKKILKDEKRLACDKSGRLWATVAQVIEGTQIEVDSDFECMHGSSVKTVQKDEDGDLFIECLEGPHLLSGQLEDDYYVGIYLAA